jgi:toxin-antitoxin system PIN domain toxin
MRSPMTEADRLALPDVNVLVALTNPNHLHHDLAHEWFAAVARFATTPITESGLLRLSLNPTVAGREVAPAQAMATLNSVRRDGRAEFLADTSTLAHARIDLSALAGHRQVTDLHLANLAASSNAVLVTFDRALPETLIRADRKHVQLIG